MDRLVTAQYLDWLGGGTLRDLLIGRLPVAWMIHPSSLHISLAWPSFPGSAAVAHEGRPADPGQFRRHGAARI